MTPKTTPIGNEPAEPIAGIGRQIRARRKALRLTQVELGLLAGCGKRFVVDLEAGKPTVRLDKLVDVAAVLGLEPTLAPMRRGAMDEAPATECLLA
ncbi:MAG: helix-turn-helix transcriptional regulator [Burkholderiales bacterium]|nr:helix-turn-helix transcriptional regulator [Burkholderiales bacterium]MCW5941887.1 helix-turn-helix transcriptional regulator [Fimbriimonadaceae bacterium]